MRVAFDLLVIFGSSARRVNGTPLLIKDILQHMRQDISEAPASDSFHWFPNWKGHYQDPGVLSLVIHSDKYVLH